MTPELHLARAARILRSAAKLGSTDYEMRIEAAMLAGTQLLNVKLHQLALTAPSEDTMHAEYLHGPARIKADLLILGVGGTVGPSLARLARRASIAAGVERRIAGVSRFSSGGLEAQLGAWGIETLRCDLLEQHPVRLAVVRLSW